LANILYIKRADRLAPMGNQQAPVKFLIPLICNFLFKRDFFPLFLFMKTVLLIRHAKSSWGDLSLPDFDRPLNDRGKADAPKMAKRIYKKKIEIDTFISSPAKRAKKTAEIFAEQYGIRKADILFVPELYHATDDTYYDAIASAPGKSDSIAIFSHNPGITEFANRLTENRIDNMPTCSVFAVKADIEDWSQFRQATKEVYLFDFPKSADTD